MTGTTVYKNYLKVKLPFYPVMDEHYFFLDCLTVICAYKFGENKCTVYQVTIIILVTAQMFIK